MEKPITLRIEELKNMQDSKVYEALLIKADIMQES